MNTSSAPTDCTRIRRLAELASYEQASLHAVIDAAYLCHIAFQDAKGTHCIPTACWRQDGYLYIHGSNGGRLTKILTSGIQACVTITHLDGLVMARSAFNHAMNYRSAMIYGCFEKLGDEADKHLALAQFMEKLAPGRQAQCRPGNDKEMAATTVMRIALDEAAVKIRSGGPEDAEEDMDIPVWAGVLPLVQVHGEPIIDSLCSMAAPDYVRNWVR
ncbi:pyridoxamine 5'-phosphate oxidase family protein [Undibacterium pigrum]|uniref:Nitroimidazol reductase NimA-like FMN-containing flavoprotein (Pyridoxamine 5'-phosphate oxidase superfamily) n=1 Tax=Undibacterium pigrum TaxID=401470 RepID=A0A318JMU6_9BURK|nr:pyridoxamine 5'-phosphate oxidase family protein [Undibacterium pigrum]PXX41562.1 hypothetical protein DFR42_107213 [Undibacterium pigrum]